MHTSDSSICEKYSLAMPKLSQLIYKCKCNLKEAKYSRYQYQHGTGSSKIWERSMMPKYTYFAKKRKLEKHT